VTTTVPALSLDGAARGVQEARRWVVDAVAGVGRPELAECAEMGVSELVTNALLHGAAPISVRVAGTREHPRVEVRDGSPRPPELPARPSVSDGSGGSGGLPELDDLDDPAGLGDLDGLLTFGRGLSIVARASDAWGAEIEADGKVVWFAPSAAFADDDGPEGRITGVQVVSDRSAGAGSGDSIELQLLGVPAGALAGFERHFREVRREVRLLSLAHHDDYPLADELSELFAQLEMPVQRAVAAERLALTRQRGRPAVDVVLHLSRGQARDLRRFVDLLRVIDAFCREEKLLALARTPVQRQFQTWFLLELAAQAEGREPRPWAGPAATSRRSTAS